MDINDGPSRSFGFDFDGDFVDEPDFVDVPDVLAPEDLTDFLGA